MTSKKDKTKSGKSSFSDSNELFEAIFRSALNNLAKKKQKKAGLKTEEKTDKAVTKEPIAPEMEARPEKVKPKTEAKTKKAAVQKATAPAAREASKQFKPKTEVKPVRVKAKKPIAPAKGSTPKKVEPKAEVKMREIIMKKPVSRVEEEPPKEIQHKAEVEKYKEEVKEPLAKVKGTTPKEAEPKEEARSQKAELEPPAMPAEYDTAELELGMEGKSSAATDDEFISELLNDRFLMAALRTYMRFKGAGQGKSISFDERAAGPSKLIIGLLSGLFLVLVAAGINYFGIVDLGGLLGLSKSTDKKISTTHAPNKSPAKADNKQTRVAIKSPRERANLQQSPKTTAQAKAPVVKKTVEKPVIPAPTPKRALRVRKNHNIVKKSTKPSSPQKRTVFRSPPRLNVPKAAIPKVSKTPAKPIPSPKKPPTVKKPDKLAPSKQKTLVAKSPPKTTPIVQKKAFSPEKELFPEERSSPSYPYSVYLGAYRTVERAKKATSSLRKKGLSSYWVKVNLGDKGTWFRVFTGHFRDKQEALKFIKKKRLKDANPKKTRYAALIGVYISKKEIKRWSNVLSGLGYSPYVIDQPNGESLLCVGAFYTKAGAERQRADLASKGIRSRVAMR